MRTVWLFLRSKDLFGYDDRVFDLLLQHEPDFLSRITTLSLVLTHDSNHFPSVIKLFQASPLISFSLKTVTRDIDEYRILQPLESLRTMGKLVISASPTSQFWSSIVASWRNLTSVDFVEEQCDSTLEDALPALSLLPNLCHLRINIENMVETKSNTYFFPAIEVVEATFFQGDGAIQFFKAIRFSCLKKLDATIDELQSDNFFLAFFTVIGTTIHNSLTSLKLHVIIPEQGVSETRIQEGIPEEELRGEKLSEMSLRKLFSCEHLTFLKIKPAISCHALTNSFYACLASVWPRLERFYLGGDLLFHPIQPVATVDGLVAFLEGAQNIQRVNFPYSGISVGEYPKNRAYKTLEKIGIFFNSKEDLQSYLSWVNLCCPNICYIGILPGQASRDQALSRTLKGMRKGGCVVDEKPLLVWYVD